MFELRHKTFVGPTFYTHGATLNENRETIRAEAEEFVNRIGLDRVVSVNEHAMSWGPFSVVVWYREAVSAPAQNAVHLLTNAAIGARLKKAREAASLSTIEEKHAWTFSFSVVNALGWFFAVLILGLVVLLSIH